jgi:hypothetical protein
MKKETLQKKAWQKPEVKDLDIDQTAGGASPSSNESAFSGPAS